MRLHIIPRKYKPIRKRGVAECACGMVQHIKGWSTTGLKS